MILPHVPQVDQQAVTASPLPAARPPRKSSITSVVIENLTPEIIAQAQLALLPLGGRLLAERRGGGEVSHQSELSITLTEQEARTLIEAAAALEYNLPGLTAAVKKIKLAQAERLVIRSAS